MRNIVLFLLCSSFILLDVVNTHCEPWSFKLRRSVIDKNVLAKPAQFEMLSPEKGDNSYVIDVGLNVLPPSQLIGNSLWDFALTGEYHRNTQTEKEQNSLIMSMSILGIVGEENKQPCVILPQASLKYKYNKIENSNSIILSFDTSFLYLPLKLGRIIGWEQLGFLWQPRIGLKYENIFEAKNDGPTGSITEGYGFLDIAIFPLRARFDERLEISSAGKAWRDIYKSSEFESDSDSYYLMEYSVIYYLDEDKHYALSLSYVDGENPTTGFQKQKYSQASFKVKF